LEHRNANYCVRALLESELERCVSGPLRVFSDAAQPAFDAFFAAADGYCTLPECVLLWAELAEEAEFAEETEFAEEAECVPLGKPTAGAGAGPVVDAVGVDPRVAVVRCGSGNIDAFVDATAGAVAALAPPGTTLLFHGTTHWRAGQIAQTEFGINWFVRFQPPHTSDFGAGFYLDFDLRKALRRAAAACCMAGVKPAVLVYRLPATRRLDGTDPAVKVLCADDGVWAPFVAHNRGTGAQLDALQQLDETFDVIIGPSARMGPDGSFARFSVF
jgi:hypothetical protein